MRRVNASRSQSARMMEVSSQTKCRCMPPYKPVAWPLFNGGLGALSHHEANLVFMNIPHNIGGDSRDERDKPYLQGCSLISNIRKMPTLSARKIYGTSIFDVDALP